MDTKYTAREHTQAVMILQLNPHSLMDFLSNHHHNSLCVATAKSNGEHPLEKCETAEPPHL